LLAIAKAAGNFLADLHADPYYDRAVFTLVGGDVVTPAKALSTAASVLCDLRTNVGVHPRLGVIDVVPFVSLNDEDSRLACSMRDSFGAWLARAHELPVFIYGNGISLPEVRKSAFKSLSPTYGPKRLNSRLGAAVVGCRPPLVAFNVVIDADLPTARDLAMRLRSPMVRTLALSVGDEVQLSFNLIDPANMGPVEIVKAVERDVPVISSELVGLIPRSAVIGRSKQLLSRLGIDDSVTVEERSQTVYDPAVGIGRLLEKLKSK
jgi:glutamate formiminotransferase